MGNTKKAGPHTTQLSWQPVNGRLFVRQDAAPEKAGSLFVPEEAQEKPATGVVVASCEPEYPEGTRVLFGKYSGSPFVVDGERYLLMKAEELLAVAR